MTRPREMTLAATLGALLALLMTAGAGRPHPAIITCFEGEGIRTATYRPDRRRLLLEVAGGGGWVFDAVPPSLHRQLLRSEAPEEWVARHLLRAYPCHRVPPDNATHQP